jgi:hypothetical protein
MSADNQTTAAGARRELSAADGSVDAKQWKQDGFAVVQIAPPSRLPIVEYFETTEWEAQERKRELYIAPWGPTRGTLHVVPATLRFETPDTHDAQTQP